MLLISRTEDALTALSTQYGAANVAVLAGDVTDVSLPARAVEIVQQRWGRLDALVLNHGTLDPVRRVDEADVEAWKRGFDVNFFSFVGMVSCFFIYFFSFFLCIHIRGFVLAVYVERCEVSTG